MEKSIELLVEVPNQSSLILVSPESLSVLLLKLSGSVGRPEGEISLLYNRKGSWFKIADDETYKSILKRTISQGNDEIEMKIEFLEVPLAEEAWDLMSNVSHINLDKQDIDLNVPKEETKIQVIKSDPQASVYYRYLNGTSPQTWVGVNIDDLDILLIHLSNTIVTKEGLSSSEWVCAFYTEDGNSLTGTLAQLNFVRCNEVFPLGSRLTVFIVPNFDIKTEDKLQPSDGPNTLVIQSSKDETVTYKLNINFETAKVIELKQIVYYFTNIPTYEIQLKSTDSFLSRNDALLSEYSLVQDQVITFESVCTQYDHYTYKKKSKQSVEQSTLGLQSLHSLLHSFGKLIEISEKPIRESLLGYIRQFTSNSTPYLTSLLQLSKSHPQSLLSSIALEEGSIILARTVMTQVFNETFEESKLLENIIEIYGFMCDLSFNQYEELSREEIYLEFDITCPLTSTELKDPVLIRRTDAKNLYYEHSEVLKKIKAGEEIKFVGKPNENELKVDENFRYVVKRRSLSNYGFGLASTYNVFLWNGIFDTTKTLGQLVAQKFPQGITLTKAGDLKRAYKITKIVPPLSLKASENKDCMTLNKSKELVISLGPSNKEPNKVDLMNILTRACTSIDIDDLASAIEMRNPGQAGQEVISRNPDEAIVVVFDVSGSMGTRFFDDQDFTRLDATKEFFETFTDRNAGFDLNHVISLLLFSSNLNRACGFTENIVTFAAHIQNAAHGGGTKLWDALNQAIEYLKEFKNSYPNVHLRILCLSDGEDTSSINNYTDVAKSLVHSNITLDSIVVGALSQQLKAVSFASGGYVFLPKTIPEGIKLFESETFLSVRARIVPTRTLVNSQADLIPLLSKDFSNSQPVSAEAPKQIKAKSILVSDAAKKINAMPESSFKSSKSSSSGCMKRVAKELNEISTNPHPNFAVFPNDSDILFWNIFMTGPETTPYEGGCFHLYLTIPSDYPFKPPNVKFLTPIYHCNINSSGSICHSVLKDQWSPAITIRKVFDYIYGLLLTPEPLDPLDANIATEYRVDFPMFLQHAVEHTQRYASKTAEQLINELQPSQEPPPQFLCGITGKIMTDPVLVIPTNNTYERTEIENVINTTGKDPKTGDPISKADLVTNTALMYAIQEFNKTNAKKP
jgi:ubiquitin-protein ligase